MIAKVVGYHGFQSYGDLPYAALKPGRRTLDSNDVWEKTIREEDKQSFYHNSNYIQTMKQNKIDQTVQPINYKNVQTVIKGTNGLTQSTKRDGFFSQAGYTAMANTAPVNDQLMKTGVEHWQTSYQASTIMDPSVKNRSVRPEWTYPRPPHQVQSKVGPSEYKKQLGGEIGYNPRDVISQLTDAKPRVFDELRLGTTQESQHPPGYTGFIPTVITASKAIEHGQGLNARKDFMKTNLKENHHTKIPGYAGHIPRSVVNQKDEPRTSCLGKSQQ